MKFNATELPTSIYGSIGVMLDPLVAKINHSCEPNLSIHRPQQTMTSDWMNSAQLSEDERETFIQLIPLRDIQEGEELLQSYIAPTVSVDIRKAKLKEDYFFECNCLRCLSDAQAITALAAQQPGLSAQFEQWAKDVTRHCSQIGQCKSGALQTAAAAMDKSDQYLEHPVLYTTGAFPETALKLILEGLKGEALDEALINALRLYFLVNPRRFVGPHNPTNIYTVFLLLDIFDALLGLSGPGTTNEKLERCLSNLSARGLGRDGLVYWRRRICADLKKRLEGSAVEDLLVLTEKREELALRLTVQDQDGDGEGMEIGKEGEMGCALRLKEHVWETVLRESGC